MMTVSAECYQSLHPERKLPYLQFLPADYHESKTYPLVIFLCGIGECGEDLNLLTRHGWPRFAREGEDYPFILVAPQVPTEHVWFAYIETLNDWLDHLTLTLPVDKNRIYLSGLSNGGIGTWLWATHNPDRFAALIPVCGEGIEPFAPRLTSTPVWAFHGDADPVVLCDGSRRMVERINAHGGQAKLTVYEGVGHDSWERAYREPELIPWMLEQKKNRPFPAKETMP